MLGPGNEEAAKEALSTWPGYLQIGGGIGEGNAKGWIEKGAEKVGYCTPVPYFGIITVMSY
jgi:phosphoribosylformimino-5-aminoimidazole carboxamide ribotide isomerase